MKKQQNSLGSLLILLLLVSGCSSSVVQMRSEDHRNEPVLTAEEKPPARKEPAEIKPYSYVVRNKRYWVKPVDRGYRESGQASWYGKKFQGRLTANQEIFDMYKLTAAHKTLPLPSYVRVVNRHNGKSVVVRVNDRGPFVEGRIIDLSYAAAKQIGMAEIGVAPVTIEVLGWSDSQSSKTVAKAKSKKRSNYIQVDTYPSRDSALNAVRRLESNNLSPFIIKTRSDSKASAVHRVRIGPFISADELTRTRYLLNQNGFNNHRVIAQ